MQPWNPPPSIPSNVYHRIAYFRRPQIEHKRSMFPENCHTWNRKYFCFCSVIKNSDMGVYFAPPEYWTKNGAFFRALSNIKPGNLFRANWKARPILAWRRTNVSGNRNRNETTVLANCRSIYGESTHTSRHPSFPPARRPWSHDQTYDRYNSRAFINITNMGRIHLYRMFNRPAHFRKSNKHWYKIPIVSSK